MFSLASLIAVMTMPAASALGVKLTIPAFAFACVLVFFAFIIDRPSWSHMVTLGATMFTICGLTAGSVMILLALLPRLSSTSGADLLQGQVTMKMCLFVLTAACSAGVGLILKGLGERPNSKGSDIADDLDLK